MNVMKRAWEIARNGVKQFGGMVKEYFAVALKMAWAEVKNEVKRPIEVVKEKLEKEFAKPRLGSNLIGLSVNVWEKYGKARIYVNGDGVIGYFDFNQDGKVNAWYFDCGYDYATKGQLNAIGELIQTGEF